MHTELKFQVQVIQSQVDPESTLSVKQDESGRFTLIVSSPGSRIAAIRIGGIGELQLKAMVQSAINVL